MVKSMVEKAKAIEHTINTSLLEQDEMVNHFNGKEIYVNQSIHDIKTHIYGHIQIYIYTTQV